MFSSNVISAHKLRLLSRPEALMLSLGNLPLTWFWKLYEIIKKSTTKLSIPQHDPGADRTPTTTSKENSGNAVVLRVEGGTCHSCCIPSVPKGGEME